jgi:hypothetical protein
MDSTLSSLLPLNVFSTGRRLHTFRSVLPIAQKLGLADLEAHLTSAVEADKATWDLELKWAVQRRRGKLSDKQKKAQRALQQLDGQVDRALVGLRDGAAALVRGAGPDEQALVEKVETFLDNLFPNGAQAVTSLPYAVELTAVQGIVEKLGGELAPIVADLGLGVQAARIAKLCAQYGAAQKGVESLEFGALRAARAEGQGRLLEVVAMILGAYHAPSGDPAKKRAELLAPILKQHAAISYHLRARRSVPEVNPATGEEEPADVPGDPEPEPAPA